MRGRLVALVLALALMLCLTPVAAQSGCYTPQEAASHVGEYICVSGRITNVFWARESTGRPTFVDMGRGFTVVIWEEDRDRFQPPPESWRGATLTVWGQIRLYQGRPEIILRSPAQFAPSAMAQPTPPPPPPPTPPPTAPPAPATALPATPVPTAIPTPPPTPILTPEPTPEPSPSPATPTPAPFPAAPGPAVPQARVVLTPPPAVLEGPVDDPLPVVRPDDRSGPPVMLIAGAVALLVLGLGGSVLARRKRE